MTKDSLPAVRCVREGIMTRLGPRSISCLLAIQFCKSMVGERDGICRSLDWLASVRCVQEITANVLSPTSASCLLGVLSCRPMGRGDDAIGGFLLRAAASRSARREGIRKGLTQWSMSRSYFLEVNSCESMTRESVGVGRVLECQDDDAKDEEYFAFEKHVILLTAVCVGVNC